ncbi:ABC transporter ATP-binding protein [Bradyrhizobium canariense]|uniref:ABC transporter ATP-binding protein n=1 Tax=Bradyrhizobium TaxID=374 RepID=UPI000A19B032|nr:ABC transporter ATP-binding protein [Bradyrhizobium canariense]OSI30548.1 peptide ABC transporter ATP-binding protein [Bradyrhizobium canariense]OSI37309.1 peptide ABC transporter ATP-binding protein [Bradyrhizobium canariense]OSI52029.1 peptide ABC transporter ATP-binding protein [Bradyrhizobium canariense]OSI56332.1 peptide ABC transporter ATP-binding protein [Bradyrhizobium canariense]OSI59404.1 peptide ABC transporter ATP-binding protein [Bradyrhizobium canariense]
MTATVTTPVTPSILSVENLRTHFFTRDGVTRAVDGVSFDVKAGDTLGVVGESGSGKSVTALSIMRLLPPKLARTVSGRVRLEGQDILTLSEADMREIRGNRMAMIFQEPMTSLNPVLTIGDQIAEAVMIHQKRAEPEAMERAAEMLHLVRIPDAERRLKDYPHQFSGGMRQRVMIAMALSCNPKLLIADEPTTALDVTIQAQILRLMLEVKERIGAAVMLITHDLGVVAETCQRVIVMYAGQKVEEAEVKELFDRPLHPYTRALIASLPRRGSAGRSKRLFEIPGIVPTLNQPIRGCAFAPRCAHATERCRAEAPPFEPQGETHFVACWEAVRVFAA